MVFVDVKHHVYLLILFQITSTVNGWTRVSFGPGAVTELRYRTLALAGRRDGGAQRRENNTSLNGWRTDTRFMPCRHSIDKNHLLNPFTAPTCTLSGLKSTLNTRLKTVYFIFL